MDPFDVKTISFDKISFAEGLKKWLSCFKCGRHLLQIILTSEMLAKCVTCNTLQMLSSCDTKAGVRIAVRDSHGELIWLNVFTRVLKEMVRQPAPNVTLQSPDEDIYEQLFNLRNVTVEYSAASGIIKSFYLESV